MVKGGDILKPNVLTKIKIPNTKFVLNVYAFRKLRSKEAKLAIAMWLRQSNRQRVPKCGTGTLFSIFGFDD